MARVKGSTPQVWSQETIAAFLQQLCIPIRLASVTATGWPVVLSLWYLYENGRFYCATQKTAKIVAHLKREPRCAFEVAGDQPPYRGVRGQGKARVTSNGGAELLERLLKRYLNSTDSPLATSLLARSADEVIIEIEPVAVSTWDFTDRMRDSL
ncbi:MAG: pyridoxamine 5'-phosphate oxidase family protein [Candidatus Binatia bacterium]